MSTSILALFAATTFAASGGDVPMFATVDSAALGPPLSLGATSEYRVQPNVVGLAENGLLEKPMPLSIAVPGETLPLVAIRKFEPIDGFSISKEGELFYDVDPAKLSYNIYAVGEGIEVTVAVHRGIMSAVATVRSSVYSVGWSHDGPAVRVLDTRTFPIEASDVGTAPDAAELVLVPTDPAPTKNLTDIVDVLVLYTNNALAVAGGQGALDALIQNSFLDMNVSLENSLVVSARVRNVLPGGAQGVLVNYNESPGIIDPDPRFFAHRVWARTDPQATVDPVTGRDAHLADLVVLLVGDAGYCGVAYTQRPNCGVATGELGCGVGAAYNAFAVSVVSTFCAVQSRSFAHEVGHQFGLEHDPPWGITGGGASFLWSYGHTVSNATVQTRTIMAYETLATCPFTCPIALHYSNPNVDFQAFPGTATGSLVPDGQGRTKFNARTVSLLSEAMVNFRGPAVLDRIFRGSFEALPDM